MVSSSSVIGAPGSAQGQKRKFFLKGRPAMLVAHYRFALRRLLIPITVFVVIATFSASSLWLRFPIPFCNGSKL